MEVGRTLVLSPSTYKKGSNSSREAAADVTKVATG
jgi:hypothetical protein